MRVRGFFTSIAIVFAAFTHSSTVEASDDSESPKRPLPDYDGRGTKPEGDGAGVWTARVALSPLYFTSEFLLRRPLGALVTAAERADLFRKFYDFFAFGPDHSIGFLPVGFVEFGFNPSVGIYAFWNDAFAHNNNIHLHYEAWPDDWIAGDIVDRYQIGAGRVFELRAFGGTRPDQVFYGIGPNTVQSSQSRYKDTRFDARATLETRTWRASRIEAAVGLRKVDLSPGHYYTDPSLEQEAAHTFEYPVPFGFNRGYVGPYGRFLASLDTRRPNAKTGSGLRIEAQAEEGADVEHAPASGWIRYGGDTTLFIDLNDRGRVLSLSAAALFADPLAHDAIPFTELVSLGGDKWMPGYFAGRMVDRSAVVAKLAYSWPVAPWLDGTFQVAVGNVFDEHLDGFKLGLLRVSGAFGLTTTSDPPLEFLFGIGTETFDHGAQVDSFRVSLGIPRRF